MHAWGLSANTATGSRASRTAAPAGITSSTVEMAERANAGIRIQTRQVPRRESRAWTPYEVMLSESQERMIAAVKPAHVADVQAWFEHWDLHAEVIGEVTSDGIARVTSTETPRLPQRPCR